MFQFPARETGIQAYRPKQPGCPVKLEVRAEQVQGKGPRGVQVVKKLIKRDLRPVMEVRSDVISKRLQAIHPFLIPGKNVSVRNVLSLESERAAFLYAQVLLFVGRQVCVELASVFGHAGIIPVRTQVCHDGGSQPGGCVVSAVRCSFFGQVRREFGTASP